VYKAEEDDRSDRGRDVVVTCANDDVETRGVYARVGMIVAQRTGRKCNLSGLGVKRSASSWHRAGRLKRTGDSGCERGQRD
jgi:hypothetical protein